MYTAIALGVEILGIAFVLCRLLKTIASEFCRLANGVEQLIKTFDEEFDYQDRLRNPPD